MITRNITVNIKEAESRPVAMLVQIASQYESKIYVESGSKKFNAKSIMGMMALGLVEGEELVLTIEGDDESDAADTIEKFLVGEN